jgi:hypothetical protein
MSALLSAENFVKMLRIDSAAYEDQEEEEEDERRKGRNKWVGEGG